MRLPSMPYFAYAPDMLKPLRETWHEFRRPESEAPALPDDAYLREILEICYHASFTVEESRRTRFSIVLAPPDQVDAPLVFEQPRPLSVHELMRLAPVATVHAIGVGPGQNSNVPFIWGLSGGAHMEVTITVSGPGTIDIGRKGQSIVGLRGGVVVLDGGTGGIFAPISEFLQEANTAAWEGVTFAGGSWSPETVVYPGFLLEVIARLQAAGHGGTILLVPTNPSEQTWRRHLRIKYPCAGVSAWEQIRGAIALYDEGAPGRDRAGFSIYSGEAEAMTMMRRFASLGAVDGAIVLSDRYDLFGFGAEIALAVNVDQIVRDDGVVVPSDGFGTRHRAAFRFCAAHPEAMAIVCSQDGAVRCVRSVSGVVYAHGS